MALPDRHLTDAEAEVASLVAALEALSLQWHQDGMRLRLQRGQQTRPKSGMEMLETCLFALNGLIAAHRPDRSGRVIP